MKQLTIAICIFLVPFAMQAQQQFISKGKIEFERKVNVHKQLESEGDGEWIQELKKTIPQYDITYFDFFFDGNQSTYKPGREVVDTKPSFWGKGPASENVVHNDYSTQSFTSQKQVFETMYLVQDSLRKITWKLTTDTRKIAGFNCRKATGIMMDSVFIFAFYTDEIMVTGGPEGFNGLPGMILGVAIPRIHTTWFATKLEVKEVTAKEMNIPTKGRKTTVPQLQAAMQSSLKDWGKWAQRNIWLVML